MDELPLVVWSLHRQYAPFAVAAFDHRHPLRFIRRKHRLRLRVEQAREHHAGARGEALGEAWREFDQRAAELGIRVATEAEWAKIVAQT